MNEPSAAAWLQAFPRRLTVATGVRLASLRAQPAGDTLQIWPQLERQGNAAFIGTIRAVLVDSAGKRRVELSSQREDLAPELLLQASAVRDSIEVRVP